MASGTSFDFRHSVGDNASDDETTTSLTSHESEYQKERFFDELFEDKCHISVEKTEISFVQKNVECFVAKVIQKVLGSEQYQTFVETEDRKHFIRFNDECNGDNILKVGSFYEGTKNNYPDEFDFIFIFGECDYKDQTRIKCCTSKLSDIFHEQVKDLLKELNTELDSAFQLCQYKGLHGPASKIKLVFNETANIRNRTIDVDISVASRVRIEAGLPTELKVIYDEWQNMLLETGSVLVIKVYKNDHPKHETGVKFTITETEQDFVRHKMSEKQRIIYRLLKYIFNGNDANEIIRNLVRRPDNKFTKLVKYFWGTKEFGSRLVYDIPSYTIKTFMFHHVHQCKKAECSVSECLIEVLKHLLVVFNEKIDENAVLFSVTIDTMLGQPLEIADDYFSAAAIVKQLTNLIKSVINIGNHRLEVRSDIKDQIPFTERNANVVKGVLDLRGNIQHPLFTSYRTTLLLVITFIVVILVFAIMKGLVVEACDADSDTPSDKRSYAVYCCDGTKDPVEGWINVICSENDTIANNSQKTIDLSNKSQKTTALANNTKTTYSIENTKQTLIDNTPPELKWTFASMAYKLAQPCDNSSESEKEDKRVPDFTRKRAILRRDISENKEFYLYCNLTRSEVIIGDDIQLTEDLVTTCLPLTSSCSTPQHPPFLKITTMTTEEGNDTVLEHYFCDAGDNCTADTLTTNPLHLCYRNKIKEGMRTEVCCSNIDNGSKNQSDDCFRMKMLALIISIIGFFSLILQVCIIFIRIKCAGDRFIKRLRRSV